MTDFSLTDFFLTGIVTYGPLIFGLALFVGAVGVPVPGTLFVLATGAFVQQGVVSWATAAGLGLAGVVLGDSIGYGLGYFAGDWGRRRFGQSTAWQEAQRSFERRGGSAIYLTRFLLTPLAVPVNVIAGGSGYRFWRFSTFDVAGELTWLILYGGLGYVFGSQWEAISEFISDFSGVLVGVVIFAVGIYFWRRQQRPKNK